MLQTTTNQKRTLMIVGGSSHTSLSKESQPPEALRCVCLEPRYTIFARQGTLCNDLTGHRYPGLGGDPEIISTSYT